MTEQTKRPSLHLIDNMSKDDEAQRWAFECTCGHASAHVFPTSDRAALAHSRHVAHVSVKGSRQ